MTACLGRCVLRDTEGGGKMDIGDHRPEGFTVFKTAPAVLPEETAKERLNGGDEEAKEPSFAKGAPSLPPSFASSR